MTAFENLPPAPPGTHWEKRDFCVGGEAWCIVRDGLHGAIVARVPMDYFEFDACVSCWEAFAIANNEVPNG